MLQPQAEGTPQSAALPWQAMLDAIPGGVAVYQMSDPPRCLYFSAGLPSLLGYTAAEYAGLKDRFVSPRVCTADLDALKAAFFRAVAQAGAAVPPAMNLDFRIRNKAGAYCWLRMSGKLLGEQDGLPLLQCMFQNIDLQKQTEQTLLAKNAATLQNFPGGLLVLPFASVANAAPEDIFVNEGYLKLLQTDRASFFEGYNDRSSSLVSPEDAPRIAARFADLKKAGDSFSDTCRLARWDGSLVWVQMTCSLADENGCLMLYIGSLDVSESMDAQKQLYLQQQMLNAAVEHSGLFYWEYDIATRAALLSEHASRSFGLPRTLTNFPQSIPDQRVLHGADLAAGLEAFARIDNGSPQEVFDVRVWAPHAAKWMWMRCRCTVIYDDNKAPVKAICTSENVDALKDTENLFYTVMRQQGVHSWTYDLARRTLCQRAGGRDKFAQMPDVIENVPQALIELGVVHPDDEDVLRHLFDHLHAGIPEPSEKLRLRLIGQESYSWFRITYTLMREPDGSCTTALGSAVDITRQVEENHRYQEILRLHRYNAAPNILLSGYCSITGNRMLELSDRTGADLPGRFGLHRDEFYSGVASLIPDRAEREAFRSAFLTGPITRLFNEGTTSITQRFYMTLGGDAPGWYVSCNIQMMKNRDTGEVVGFLTATDITREVLTEKMINRTVVCNYNFIVLVDLATRKFLLSTQRSEDDFLNVEGQEYYDIARRFAAFYKIPAQEALFAQVNLDAVQRQLAGQEVYTVRFSHTELNGEQKYDELQFYYIDRKLGQLGLASMDISATVNEQQAQKATLARALAMANDANRAKSAFLSRISHDMRTPLNGILGLAELMRDKTDPEAIRRDISQLKVAGKYLLNLINDTLDVSKIESGKMVLHPALCRGKALFRNVLELLGPNLTARQLRLNARLDMPDVALYVDAGRVEQLLMNILGNAIKFTPPGGQIDFILENISSDAQALFDRVIVRDNGIGMDPDFLPQLFTPFTQEDNSITNSTQGTGLGMAISKSIVSLMGGEISVDSVKGRGTTFTFTLRLPLATPAQIAQGSQDERQPTDFSALAGKRVLLCEDHPLNAQIAQALLEKSGMLVEHAANGQLGVETFTRSPDGYYDAILMDVRMPVLDGLSATRAIRCSPHPQARGIPIIAMTANAFDEDVKNCLDAGMNAHLGKPFDPDRLYETLVDFLGE